MFKKIEVWILYLAILISILFSIGFGFLVRQELVGGTKLGWLSKTALTLSEIPVNLRRILKGQSGDLEVIDRFPNLMGFDGDPVTFDSYLLLSRYDGDLQEGVVELIDSTSFEVLHTWNPDVDKFNNLVDKTGKFKYLEIDSNNSRALIKRPKLTGDNYLYYNLDGPGPLIKIDACSNLVNQNTHDPFHHSIEMDIDENIWAPTRMYPQSLPVEKVGRKIREEGGYVDDAIVKLSPDGEVLFEKSVSQIFIDNGLEYLLFSIGANNLDPIHLNDIQPVDFSTDYWEKGDVFLSLRNQSMILLYRPSNNKIIWKGVGPFFHQHDVDILDEYRISIFNNNSKNLVNGDVVDGHNEVIIYDFRTDEYSSYLKDQLAKNDVRTITQGRSRILQNGDLFIEETNYGRTLYFNSDGSLRWTHVNRAKNGNVYTLGWSRILHTGAEIKTVKDFLENKGVCNE